METFKYVVGSLVIVGFTAGAVAFCVSLLLDSWRKLHERRDELVAAERSRKIALWMLDASHWFGPGDGSTSMVLREISTDLRRGGLFDAGEVRERCRAAVRASAAASAESPSSVTGAQQ